MPLGPSHFDISQFMLAERESIEKITALSEICGLCTFKRYGFSIRLGRIYGGLPPPTAGVKSGKTSLSHFE